MLHCGSSVVEMSKGEARIVCGLSFMFGSRASRYQYVKYASFFKLQTLPQLKTPDTARHILLWPFSCDNSSQAIPVSQWI